MKMTENELSKVIIGAVVDAHKELGGPGLLEDVYEECLCDQLSPRKGEFDRSLCVFEFLCVLAFIKSYHGFG